MKDDGDLRREIGALRERLSRLSEASLRQFYRAQTKGKVESGVKYVRPTCRPTCASLTMPT